jgi:hypothetical protein
VTVQVRDEELGLGLGKARVPLLALHEVRGLLTIPRTLGLVEDDDVIEGRRVAANTLVAEVVNVLDEGLHPLLDGALPLSAVQATVLVARQRLL